MPRTAPRPQAPKAPGDQAYGAAGEQLAAQAQMPLPDMRATPAPDPTGANAAPVEPGQAALDAALAMPAPEPPPWANAVPDEQITAGLPSGPGPGPEALTMGGPPRMGVREMLLKAADATGNRYYAELAQDETL